MINILGVSAIGAVFLSTHDYSDSYKPSINIAPLLETIQTIGPYNVIQVIRDNAANCKEAGAIIEDKAAGAIMVDVICYTVRFC